MTKEQKLVGHGLLHGVAVAVYVYLIVLLLGNGEAMFGRLNGTTGPLVFLLLFVLSAAVVGSLVFLHPLYMFMDGKKKESVRLLGYTIGALALVTVAIIIVVAMTSVRPVYSGL